MCLVVPSASVTSRFSRAAARILRRCDFPDPKKPEIQAPLLTLAGSLYSSRKSSRCCRTSLVTTNSSSSFARWASSVSLALTTGSMAR